MTHRAFTAHAQQVVAFWSSDRDADLLARWFVEASGDRRAAQVARPFAFLQQNGMSMRYAQAAQLVRKRGYRAILAIRHPATRLLDAFLDAYLHKRQPPAARGALRLPMPERRPYRPELRASDTVTFRAFLAHLARSQQRPYLLDARWRPQLVPQFLSQPLPFHHVLSAERIDEDLTALNLALDVTTSIPPRIEDADELPRCAPGALIDRPVADLSRKSPERAGFFDAETLGFLAQFYRDDYRLLGYDPHDIDSRHRFATQPFQAPSSAVRVGAGARLRSWLRPQPAR